MHVRGLHHRLEHGAVGRGGAEHEIGHDAVERGARRQPALAALEIGVDGELHRLQYRDLDLRKPLAAHLSLRQPAERRLLQALDAHRHDLGIGLVGDHGGAVIDLHQAAGDGDASLRKDDQRVAGLDRVDQGAHRHRLHRVERHRVGELHERPHPPMLGDADVDGEHRLAVAQRQRQPGVEEAHVIERDDDVGAGFGEVVDALHLDPEQRAVDDRERVAERARRHGAADGDRHQQAADAEQQEQVRGRHAGGLQQRDDQRARGHEGGIEHVDGGHHPRAAVGAGPGLHRREHRHDEQAARDREPGQVDRQTDAAPRAEQREKARKIGDRRDAPWSTSRDRARTRRAGTAPITVGSRMMRPAASQAARPEPIAIEIEKTARQVVTTSSSPPSTFFTSGGINERATAPTSQNQLVTIAPHSRRRSSRRYFSRPDGGGEDIALHDEIGRRLPGARDEQARAPAHQREHDHQRGELDRVAAVLGGDAADDGAEQDRDEGRALDQRVAGRKLGAGEMVGQDAVFDRPEQRRDHAEQEQRDEQDHDRGFVVPAMMQPESGDGDQRHADLRKLQALRDQGLVVAVGQLAAERREEEVGRDEDGRRRA